MKMAVFDTRMNIRLRDPSKRCPWKNKSKWECNVPHDFRDPLETYHIWPLGACKLMWLEYWNAGDSGLNMGSWPMTPRPRTVSNVPDSANMRQFRSRNWTAYDPKFSKRTLYRHQWTGVCGFRRQPICCAIEWNRTIMVRPNSQRNASHLHKMVSQSPGCLQLSLDAPQSTQATNDFDLAKRVTSRMVWMTRPSRPCESKTYQIVHASVAFGPAWTTYTGWCPRVQHNQVRESHTSCHSIACGWER